MSDNRCMSCAALHVKIALQQQEIRLLTLKVKRLETKIDLARTTAGALISSADRVMRGHSPRGTWSLAKGQKAAAQEIDGYLM